MSPPPDVWATISTTYPATLFTGHVVTRTSHNAILALVQQGRLVSEVSTGSLVGVLLDRTPFLGPRSGWAARCGDQGWLEGPAGVFQVESVRQEVQGWTIHWGHVQRGTLAGGQRVVAAVDAARRGDINRAETAGVLLAAALWHLWALPAAGAAYEVSEEGVNYHCYRPDGVVLPADWGEQLETEVNRLVQANVPIAVTWARPGVRGPGNEPCPGGVTLHLPPATSPPGYAPPAVYASLRCHGPLVEHSGEVGAGLIRFAAQGPTTGAVQTRALAANELWLVLLVGQGAVDEMRRRAQVLNDLSALVRQPAGDAFWETAVEKARLVRTLAPPAPQE